MPSQSSFKGYALPRMGLSVPRVQQFPSPTSAPLRLCGKKLLYCLNLPDMLQSILATPDNLKLTLTLKPLPTLSNSLTPKML